jgi:peptidoglycan-N-acetylglucosamine deacetylase
MMQYFLRLLSIILISTSFLGCNKKNTNGQIDTPGVALTFDDNYVEEWNEMLPLLDSFGVRATFYISNFKKFNQEQKTKLREIQNRGHEIAYHTLNHCNMNDYLKNSSMEKLVNSEVMHGLQKMRAEGFNPVTFAYPYGQHNDQLDQELLKYFKSVRALNGSTNYAKSMAVGFNNKIIYGLGIDESSKRPIGTILQLLQNTKTSNACLVLVAHHVQRSELSMQIPLYKLRKIIATARQEGLKFYTISEISN